MSGTDERHALGVQKRSSATPASFGYMSRLWGLVGAVQVDRGGESAGVVAFGMFVMHAVVQNMYRVSEKLVLKPLHVAPHCWWSASRSRSRPGSCAHSKRGSAGRAHSTRT